MTEIIKQTEFLVVNNVAVVVTVKRPQPPPNSRQPMRPHMNPNAKRPDRKVQYLLTIQYTISTADVVMLRTLFGVCTLSFMEMHMDYAVKAYLHE